MFSSCQLSLDGTGEQRAIPLETIELGRYFSRKNAAKITPVNFVASDSDVKTFIFIDKVGGSLSNSLQQSK